MEYVSRFWAVLSDFGLKVIKKCYHKQQILLHFLMGFMKRKIWCWIWFFCYFLIDNFFRMNFCNFSTDSKSASNSTFFLLPILHLWEKKRSGWGKRNFFYKCVLRNQFCDHQRPGRTKLLKSLYPNVHCTCTLHNGLLEQWINIADTFIVSEA
jgi:hypothetical protein